MKITKQQLKLIIKEEISEVFAGGDYGNVSLRKSDAYHSIRQQLAMMPGLPKEEITDELIVSILRDPPEGTSGMERYGYDREDDPIVPEVFDMTPKEIMQLKAARGLK